jgi:cytochrome c
MIRRLFALLLAGAGLLAHAGGDPQRGQQRYNSLCAACHSLDANRTGPAHRGVYGRRVGQAPGFSYSPALRNSKLVWDEANLTRWLGDPESLIPGQAMGFSVADPQDRADLVAFLKAAGADPSMH